MYIYINGNKIRKEILVRDTVAHATHINRVYHRLPETCGVSKMGHAGTGTVVHFGTPQYTVVSRVFTGTLYSTGEPCIFIYFCCSFLIIYVSICFMSRRDTTKQHHCTAAHP